MDPHLVAQVERPGHAGRVGVAQIVPPVVPLVLSGVPVAHNREQPVLLLGQIIAVFAVLFLRVGVIGCPNVRGLLLRAGLGVAHEPIPAAHERDRPVGHPDRRRFRRRRPRELGQLARSHVAYEDIPAPAEHLPRAVRVEHANSRTREWQVLVGDPLGGGVRLGEHDPAITQPRGFAVAIEQDRSTVPRPGDVRG